MSCDHTIHYHGGIAIHHLDSADVEVRIIPELGAKISGLRDKHTGREWMWSPPGGGLFRNSLASAFDQSTLTGADECLPTIAACRWGGRELPDHGELWSLPWTAETVPYGLRTTLVCPISPFRIERTATLEGNVLKLDYRLMHLGSEPEPFIWALHPLMTILPGDRLEIPACELELEVALGRTLGGQGTKISWPRPAPDIDLSLMDFGPGGEAALKGFFRNLPEKRADIINGSGRGRMSIRFYGDSLDALGVWINRGAWNGHHHVAVEPTNGSPDALDAAVKRSKHHGVILPGQTLSWQVELAALGC